MTRINFQHPETGEHTIGILIEEAKLHDNKEKTVMVHTAVTYLTINKTAITKYWKD